MMALLSIYSRNLAVRDMAKRESAEQSHTLNIIDELGRECLAIRVDQKLNLDNITDMLGDLYSLRKAQTLIE